MIVSRAKDVARQWVIEEVSKVPGFAGAFFHGSINWLPDETTVPATSDVDVMVVFADPPPLKLGKFIYRDVLLEVSYLPSDKLQSPELVLSQSHMAGSFWKPSIIADPSGQLATIHEVVSSNFTKRQWVTKRCEHARDKVLRNLQRLDASASAPFHDQVLAWLFGTGVTTHMLLVAGLKNPTVRRRYVATLELLAEYGHLDFYRTLLEMLGCAQMRRARVEHHLAALTDVFDAAQAVVKTPFFFASDISEHARPIAIDGTRQLIERGTHREAIFWMVVTYSRCQKVLHHDAPEQMQDKYAPGYRQLLGDLGITSFADRQPRGKRVKGQRPRVLEVTVAILAANPGIAA